MVAEMENLIAQQLERGYKKWDKKIGTRGW